jgi:hypothetical protein
MEEEAIKKLIAMLSVNTGEDVTYEYASARINELVWLYGELRKWELKRKKDLDKEEHVDCSAC